MSLPTKSCRGPLNPTVMEPARRTTCRYDKLRPHCPLVSVILLRKTVASPVPQPSPSPRETRADGGLVVAAGIMCDRLGSWELSTWLWMAGLLASAAVVALSRNRSRTAAILVALTLLAAGGARHHLYWSVRKPVRSPRFHRISTPSGWRL